MHWSIDRITGVRRKRHEFGIQNQRQSI